jgi:hypothetical protein
MTRIYATFDYETFFGADSGSVERSIIEPSNALDAIARRAGVRFTFFADAGHLVALRRAAAKHSRARRDYERLAAQLRDLKSSGHSIQLHVHPHWEDSAFNGECWKTDTRRYRADQFSPAEVESIVTSYKAELVGVLGAEVVAFRAGGWCVQPFSVLRDVLLKIGISIDTASHKFDFRSAPDLAEWRFNSDPLVPDDSGLFRELPISSIRYSRRFYAHMAAHRILRTAREKMMGDGAAIGSGKMSAIRSILWGKLDFVSSDGPRARLLEKAYEQWQSKEAKDVFVILGHPKATSKTSLDWLSRFCEAHRDEFQII